MAEELLCPHCNKSLDDFINNEKEKKDDLKELYKRYNQCRDLELDRFWKNSVFVWVFLALCFGTFGKVFLDYLTPQVDEKNAISESNLLVLLCGISFFGFLLSKIWTWMARGLKAWYEVYECAIWDLESKNNEFKFERKYTIENYWSIKNNGVWFLNAGRISPSRIVILIGHLMSCAWGISFLIWLWKKCNCTFGETNIPVLSFWGIIIGGVIIISVCYLVVHTTTLRNSEEEMYYREIRNDLNAKDFQQKYSDNKSKNSVQDSQVQSPKFDDNFAIDKLYLSVKKDKIEFFFPNKEEKAKYESILTNYMMDKFDDGKICCLKRIWNKIKRNFIINDIERDDILQFKNKRIKDSISKEFKPDSVTIQSE